MGNLRKRRSRHRIVAVVMLAWTMAGGISLAASPETDSSLYKNLRYDDDFSYLRDPAKRKDFWDGAKYIRLGDDPETYVTFGGELRERFESYTHPNFGIKAPVDNNYILHRLQIEADLHIGQYVRGFLQLSDDLRFGRRKLVSTTDVNRLDVSQAFVDLSAPTPYGSTPTLRIGREELAYGFQRIIAVREGPNVRRTFDGFRVIEDLGGVRIDLLAVRPVVNNEGIFDDTTNTHQQLYGAYIVVPAGPVKLDFYALTYENSRATYRGLTGDERRNTFGTRLSGAAYGFDWNAEATYQTGSFKGRDIQAWLLAAVNGYTFRTIAWSPRIGLEGNAASGDNTRHPTITTFNALYPRLPYFAETSLLVPANIYDVRPTITVKPLPQLTIVAGYDMLWRVSSRDGLYQSGMVLYTGTNKTTGSRVGSEFSLDARLRPDEHLTLGAIYARFLAGDAIRAAGGKSVNFAVLFATYKF